MTAPTGSKRAELESAMQRLELAHQRRDAHDQRTQQVVRTALAETRRAARSPRLDPSKATQLTLSEKAIKDRLMKEYRDKGDDVFSGKTKFFPSRDEMHPKLREIMTPEFIQRVRGSDEAQYERIVVQSILAARQRKEQPKKVEPDTPAPHPAPVAASYEKPPELTGFAAFRVSMSRRMGIQPKLPGMVFGKADWEQNVGSVGEEPPLPTNIAEILNAPCPFCKGKKVHETHILVLIPEKIGTTLIPEGMNLTLNLLKNMSIFFDQAPQLEIADTTILYDLGENIEEHLMYVPHHKSHWVLLTKENIPDSNCMEPDQQFRFLQPPYEMPPVTDLLIAIWAHLIKTKERLYRGSFFSTVNTYCQERITIRKSDGTSLPLAVGDNMSTTGPLSIFGYSEWTSSVPTAAKRPGICAYRKL